MDGANPPPIPALERTDEGIDVLHVDDDPGVVEITALHLQRESDRITVETATSPDDGLDALEANDFDCIVSDYQMPEMNGLDFLTAVRDRYSGLPFVLFTGKGSEEIASDAISAGVTDYLQKETGTDQYAVLANRIENAVDQHRNSDRLERVRRWFRTLTENSSDLITVIDADGTVTYRNGTTDPVLGTDPGDVVGGDAFEDFIHPEDRERARTAFEQVRDDPASDSLRLEFRAKHADGSWQWVEATVADQRHTIVDGFVVTTHDIAARKRRERELERQNDLFEKAQAIADVGAWEYDVATETLSITDGVRRIFRIPDEEQFARPEARSYFHPDDQSRVRESFQRAIDHGEAFELEVRIRTTDDETRWVRTRGEPQYEDGEFVRLRGTTQDITKLKERERQFETLHDASRDLMRGATQTEITDITADAAENVLGYPNTTIRLHDEDDDVLRTATATEGSVAQAGERPDYDIDGDTPAARTFRSGDPEIYDDLTTVRDDYDRGGLVSGMYFPIGDHGVMSIGGTETNAFDETDRRVAGVLAKLAAEALTRVASAAELQRKNERLDEFASIVAHDLRNPLTVARANANAALDEDDLDRIEDVITALDRMDALIHDVLTLARQGHIVADPTSVDLERVARRAWNSVETDDAALRIEDALGIADADTDRLRELFENLFRNSVEHGSTDSRLGTDASVEHSSTGNRAAPADSVEHSLTVTVGRLDDGLFVEDDGQGIPEAERSNVLEPGYSTAADGTGYGLYIVAEVVSAHGWNIAVTEGRHGGARFEITGLAYHGDD
jgi:PAS domain S-box-containing protein